MLRKKVFSAPVVHNRLYNRVVDDGVDADRASADWKHGHLDDLRRGVVLALFNACETHTHTHTHTHIADPMLPIIFGYVHSNEFIKYYVHLNIMHTSVRKTHGVSSYTRIWMSYQPCSRPELLRSGRSQ